MAFVFPTLPRAASAVLGLSDNAGRLKPPTGGPSQTILRPGDRRYARVTLPTLDADCADAWIAVMIRHKTEGGSVRLTLPLKPADGLPAGAQIDGAGQAGALLAIKGLGVGQILKPNRNFSIIVSGRSYLHSTTSQTTADGTGKAIATIGPMLRVSPGNGLALNFTAPIIEGELDLGPVEWTVERLRFVGVSFTITEIE
jgi:hypothetical protein